MESPQNFLMWKPTLTAQAVKRASQIRSLVAVIYDFYSYAFKGDYAAYLIGEEGAVQSSLLYLGSSRYFDDLYRILNVSSPQATRLGRVNPLNFQSMLRRHGHDLPLIVIELVAFWPSICHQSSRLGAGNLSSSSEQICNIPAYTDPVIHLKASIAETVAAMRSSRMRQKVRRTMREGFGAQIGESEEDLRYFYQKLWLPMVTVQHGKSLRIPSLEEFLHKKHKYLLFFLTRNNERIAAGIFIKPRFNQQLIRFMWVGFRAEVLADSNDLNIVNVALYLQAFEIAHARGYSQVLMGPTPPTLSVGSLWYKISWGADVDVPSRSPILSFKYQSKEVFLRSIAERPVLHCKEGGINACVKWPENQIINDENLGSLLKKYWFQSLRGIDIAGIESYDLEQKDSRVRPKSMTLHAQDLAVNWL